MQNLTDEIKDLLLTRSLLLQRVSNSLTKDIINAYVSVIDDILAQIATGKNINLINMNKIIKELNAKLTPDLTSVNDDLVQLGISEASYVVNGINGAIGIDLVSKLPTDRTVQKIVNTSLMDGLTISEWLGKQDKAFQETLTKQIRLAVIEGETNPQIVSRLKGALDIKNNNNIKTIVRTAVATVTSQVRDETYKENSDVFKGYEWNATLDGRTRKEHAAYDGMAHDLNGKGINEKGKKYAFIKAPNGWNCRCISLPITKSFKELGIPLDEVPKGTRSSIDGYVSRDTTFEKWFEGKPKSFQEEYLGKGRYELYKKGTISFSDLANQNGRTLKISELTKISPVAKVSNIPTIDFGYDGKFNKYVADIRDEAKIVIDKLPKPKSIEESGGMYLARTVELKASGNNANTFRHEYGHHIDHAIGEKLSGLKLLRPSSTLYRDGLNKAFEIDKKALKLNKRNDTFDFIDKIKEEWYEKAVKFKGKPYETEYLKPKENKYGALSDIFDAMTNGTLHNNDLVGHGSKYYKDSEKKGMESMANLFDMWSSGDEDWNVAKKYLPNMTKEFELIMKEVIDGKFD